MRTYLLVSIVIPVYKAESSIEKCVKSVLSQSYPNLEVILVEDGSPDNSGMICDELAKQDSRIRVIHKENGGVSTARNWGIEEAKGDYICFIDSDDWVEENHIESLLPIEDEEMVLGGRKHFIKGTFKNEEKITERVATKNEWKNHYTEFAVGQYDIFFIGSLFKLDIIKKYKICFNEKIAIGEDALFNLQYMKYIEKIRYEKNCTYCYDGDEENFSLSRKFHPNKMESEILVCKMVEELTERPEYKFRYLRWLAVFKHLYKWEEIGTEEVKKEAIKKEKECYKNEYFKASISWVRKNGTLDQKIETYFMHYLLYPFYKPFYGFVVNIYKLKNRLKNN